MEITFGIGTILILSALALGFGLLILVILLAGVLSEVSKTSEINNRTFKIEHLLTSLASNIQMNHMENQMNQVMNDQRGQGGEIVTYHSPDGKYSARTPEELFMKMANDPESGVSREDLETLKRIFEKLTSEEEKDDEDEDS